MQNNSEKDLSSLLEEIRVDLVDYANKRMKWMGLLYQERGSKLFAGLVHGLLVVGIVFMILFLSLIGLALYIGSLFNDPYMGFLILSACSLVVLVLILLFGTKIKNYILNQSILFLRKVSSDDDTKDDDHGEE